MACGTQRAATRRGRGQHIATRGGSTDVVWDGTTKIGSLVEAAAATRLQLADCAKQYDWNGVFAVLADNPGYTNSWRPGGGSWFAPLHQAAHGAAPLPIVEQLIDLGAWRELRTANGERALEIAQRVGAQHLMNALVPEVRQAVPPDELRSIESHFHDVIRSRARHLVDDHALRLPALEVMLGMVDPKLWFPVRGMYGGFSFWLEVGDTPRLVSESWSRVVGGSGQRHVTTAEGPDLVDEGFV